jgi:hypothetical protein
MARPVGHRCAHQSHVAIGEECILGCVG